MLRRLPMCSISVISVKYTRLKFSIFLYVLVPFVALFRHVDIREYNKGGKKKLEVASYSFSSVRKLGSDYCA